MNKKLKILVLIRDFGKKYPKHKQKYESIKALEEFAEVYYWHEDGSIIDILEKLNITPDFILHYDIAWNYTLAPKISDLDKVNIAKGCYVIDIHWGRTSRPLYFLRNKVDLIFSVTKSAFLNSYSSFGNQFRWTPFSINSDVIKDWQQDKDIKFLLMGLIADRYPFREAVLKEMQQVEGFKHYKHPGHMAPRPKMVNEAFAKEINRAEIFFTCGGAPKYPVIKYFEVPGCRTLLLAEPNPDILDLGFIDGENFVACDATDFYEKAMYYSNNKEERERITDNGYQFIHRNHTNEVRAKQMITYIEEVLEEK